MVIIIAKKNLEFAKHIFDVFTRFNHFSLPYDLKFVSNLEDLQALISEFTTEESIVPIVVFIGAYLNSDNSCCGCRTDAMMEELRKREKCLTVLISTLQERTDMENLRFYELEVDYYLLWNIIHTDTSLAQIVEEKDIRSMGKVLKHAVSV